jgi:hypothetical protein
MTEMQRAWHQFLLHPPPYPDNDGDTPGHDGGATGRCRLSLSRHEALIPDTSPSAPRISTQPADDLVSCPRSSSHCATDVGDEQWRDLPERFSDWKNVHRRLSRSAKSGVWQRVFEHLAESGALLRAMTAASPVQILWREDCKVRQGLQPDGPVLDDPRG